mmetsp:Transcript_104804/g.163393  ORF Transcript_104804/g.163393 Transcript_104804/m.163393 type:complete len:228 (-) Transcript_104804:350-1033(-)
MSHSWKVLSIAVVFWAFFKFFAIAFLIRVILTRRSGLLSLAVGADAVGAAVACDGGAAALGAAVVGASTGFAPSVGASPRTNVQIGSSLTAVPSTGTRTSINVPDSCAVTSTVTLSVSMRAMISPFFTKSPVLNFHSCTVPSVILSAPKSGVFIVNFSPVGAAVGVAACAALGGGVPPSVNVHRAAPTSAVPSTSMWISPTVPSPSAFTSTVTLSVSIMAMRSPFFT